MKSQKRELGDNYFLGSQKEVNVLIICCKLKKKHIGTGTQHTDYVQAGQYCIWATPVVAAVTAVLRQYHTVVIVVVTAE